MIAPFLAMAALRAVGGSLMVQLAPLGGVICTSNSYLGRRLDKLMENRCSTEFAARVEAPVCPGQAVTVNDVES